VLKIGKFSALDFYDVLDFFATDCTYVQRQCNSVVGFFFFLRNYVFLEQIKVAVDNLLCGVLTSRGTDVLIKGKT
jgi:hypothetical protein